MGRLCEGGSCCLLFARKNGKVLESFSGASRLRVLALLLSDGRRFAQSKWLR